MDCIQPFTRKISQYSVGRYNGGAKFKNGDTLLAKITPCLENGKTSRVDFLAPGEVAFGSTEFIVLRAKENADSEYIYYLARSPYFRKKAISCMYGTSGRKRVDEDVLKLQEFCFPSHPERKRIAATLSALDSKIELNNQLIEKLESGAKLLFDYWFVQYDFPNKHGKPYKSSGGKMVYSERLKRSIPDGWNICTLLDIADFFNGLAMQKYRPLNKEKLPVIKIKEMHEGIGRATEYARANIPAEAIVETGDVLFSWSASLEVQLWARGRGALNQHIFKVTSKKYPKSFYYFHLCHYVGHFVKIAMSRKTTMGHITRDHLEQSQIACPPSPELTFELEKIISPIFRRIISLRSENALLIAHRDWLLPMLMNGQVRAGV